MFEANYLGCCYGVLTPLDSNLQSSQKRRQMKTKAKWLPVFIIANTLLSENLRINAFKASI